MKLSTRIPALAFALAVSALTLVGCPAPPTSLGWIYAIESVYDGTSTSQLPNGQYFSVGYNYLGSYTLGQVATALSISSTGDLLWWKSIDGLYVQGWWNYGIPVSASEFVVTGADQSYNYSTGRLRAVKLGATGNVIWDHTYGEDQQEPRALCATGDGGCVIASHRSVRIPGATTYPNSFLQIVLRKLDSNGAVVWERFLRPPNEDMAVYRMISLSDGGFAVVGSDSHILRADSEGNPVWWNSFSKDWATATGVGETSDGGIVLIGTSIKSFPTPVLFKTDSNGNLLWTAENIILNQGNSQYTVRDALVDTDGRIVVVGQVVRVAYLWNFFPAISDQSFIMQLDASGQFNWSRTLGVHDINSVAVTNSGDYVTTGSDGAHLQVLRFTTSGQML